MNITPVGKNVIIEPEKVEEQTKAGIILSVDKDEKPEKGTVFAVGPDADKTITRGSKVLFKKYAPDEVVIEENKYLICEDSDILAVITDEK